MDYIFYQAAAVNGFDAVGHYLRAGLLVNQCTTYAVAPVAGLLGEVPGGRERVLAGSARRPRSRRRASDPVLRATAIALAQALGQEVEKARKQQAKAKQPKATRKRGAQERKPRKPARRGGKPKRDEEIPEAIPTVDPAAPDARADRGARGAAAAPAADRRARGGRAPGDAHRRRRRPRTRPTRCWTTSSAGDGWMRSPRRRHRLQPRADRRRDRAGDPRRRLPVLQRQQGPAVRARPTSSRPSSRAPRSWWSATTSRSAARASAR